MEAPFIYGKLAADKYFTNRKQEVKQLRTATCSAELAENQRKMLFGNYS